MEEAIVDHIAEQKEKQSELLLGAIQRKLVMAGAGSIDQITGIYYNEGGEIRYSGMVYFSADTNPQAITNVRQKPANFCDIIENSQYSFGVGKVVKIGNEITIN